jgi:hypothetical protein
MNNLIKIIRKQWLATLFLIITISAGIWAYVGYTDLAYAFQALKTPMNIVLPTAISIVPIPTRTLITNSRKLELTATPTPGELTPFVSNKLLEFLGEKLHPVMIAGKGWHLMDLSGKLYYRWDEVLLEWLALPETKDRYCDIPLVSFNKIDTWGTICYLDFSGSGVIPDSGIQTDVVLTKGYDGKVILDEEHLVLYELAIDPIQGYQWIESQEGFIKRISAAAKLISEINPQLHRDEIILPDYIPSETHTSETSFTARYIGSVNHEFVNLQGESLGSVMLHLFARNKNVLFWISGEGQVLGVKTGFPYYNKKALLSSQRLSFLYNSDAILTPNARYELIFFASQYVQLDPDNDKQIDLNHPITLSFFVDKLINRNLWITKQLIMMLYDYHMGADWIINFTGELESSPPSLVPYFYILKR